MKSRFWPVLNLLVVFATIFLSYYSNTGAINGNTMGSLSNDYDNYFTPAGYAFSIWGLIYIGLIGNAIYLLRKTDKPTTKTQAIGLTVANLANCTWVFLWLYEYTALSTLAMSVILIALISLTVKLRIGFQKLSLWTWWPISIYAGWITVAIAANITAYLSKIGWNEILSEPNWALTLIVITTLIFTFLILKRRLAYAGYVGVWALVAIAMKQWGEQTTIQWLAIACAVLLSVQSVYKDYKYRTKVLA